VPGPIAYADALPRTADLVIVGGGVVGAATAFHAAKVGLSPVIVERRPALCTLTTPASTGAFRLQFDNLEELSLVRESVDLFLNFADATRQRAYDLRIRQQGYLWATTDAARAERARALVDRQHGWGQTDIEFVDGDEARERWPYLSPAVVGARWRAGDGFLDPKALTMGLVAGSGAGVVVDCAVTGWAVEGDRLAGVETTRGTISTRLAVIAAGPFAGAVAALAGIDLPVHTVQRQKLVLPEVEAVPPGAPMTIDDDTGAHWRPALRGAYILFTDPTTPPTEPTENVPPDYAHAFRVLRPESGTSAARIAPFWAEVWNRNAVTWLVHAGQYTMTPDHRPLLGETPIAGLFVNGGYSGHGIMVSAAGSRHLLDVMTGAVASTANPFGLDREFVHRDLDVL
jgi:sarcosine oxidase, subunit beta